MTVGNPGVRVIFLKKQAKQSINSCTFHLLCVCPVRGTESDEKDGAIQLLYVVFSIKENMTCAGNNSDLIMLLWKTNYVGQGFFLIIFSFHFMELKYHWPTRARDCNESAKVLKNQVSCD